MPSTSKAPLRANEQQKMLSEIFHTSGEQPWGKSGGVVRDPMHGYFQYPAMMVPQVQGSLIDHIVSICPELTRVYDAFMGSGTTMTEAMLRGLNFTGVDINPLALLLCRAKSGPFHEHALIDKIDRVSKRIHSDKGTRIEVRFPGRDKWFTRHAAIELSRIRRAILGEEQLWFRRFAWVALAETVRLTSNSRTSTYKLHIREPEELRSRQVSPIRVFEKSVQANLENLLKHKKALDDKGFLRRGRYIGQVHLMLGDIRQPQAETLPLHDLLITSPPYGDNKSTVPYGQHSYLPLQWIELSDIDETLDKSLLATTHEIDTRSLGGSQRITKSEVEELRKLSPSFAGVSEQLANQPPDRLNRVAAFYRDLNKALPRIMQALAPNAYLVWTVGNRRVGACQIPTDEILIELLEELDVSLVTRMERMIERKRMAPRNSIAATMDKERILVMQRNRR